MLDRKKEQKTLHKDDEPSYFVVDLRKKLFSKTKTEKSVKNTGFDFLEEKIEKLDFKKQYVSFRNKFGEIEYKKIIFRSFSRLLKPFALLAGYFLRIGKRLSGFLKIFIYFPLSSARKTFYFFLLFLSKIFSWRKNSNKQTRETFAFIFLKPFKLFYDLCYHLGKATAFIIGLPIFLPKKIFLLIKNGALKIFSGSRRERRDDAVEYETDAPAKTARDSVVGQTKVAWNFSGLRRAFFFALVLVAIALPFKAFTYYKNLNLEGLKGRVLGESERGAQEIMDAFDLASSLDFEKAAASFEKAGNNFSLAQKEAKNINNSLLFIASLLPNDRLRLASESDNILEAGRLSAELGNELSLMFFGFNNTENGGLKERIGTMSDHGQKAAVLSGRINKEINTINRKNIPKEYEEEFALLKEKISIFEKAIKEFNDIVKKAENFLGMEKDKRYLLVFQNNAEMRASGGFIGSYALIDFRDGKIKNMETPGGGSYDTEAGLLKKIIAPEPLWLVNPLWHFWDANWWPDWPTSARKLMWFYEKSDGSTVDGVISVTPTALEKILEAIGPIDMTENYGTVIDQNNLWITLQELAEQKDAPDNKPKKIIGDLAQKITDELPARVNGENILKLFKALEESLSEKHILIYLNDETLREKVSALGWSGEIKETARDYLMVTNTNIAGGKSDKKIKEEISHKAEIMPDGSIIDTLIVKRTHEGIKNEKFTGTRNVDWMRIYVPEGSELLDASGFSAPDKIYFESPDGSWEKDADILRSENLAKTDEKSGVKIYDEAGKTVFGNWTMVDPGESTTIYLKYRLPFKINLQKKEESVLDRISEKLFGTKQEGLDFYSLLAQKQPGSIGSDINSIVELKNNAKITWKYPDNLQTTKNGYVASERLETDQYWAVIMESNNE